MKNYFNNIPTKDTEFNTFQDGFIKAVKAHSTAWGLTNTELDPLLELQSTWQQAWLHASSPDNSTAVQRHTKVMARKAYQAALGRFINARIYGNSLLSPADILLCGLKPRSTKRTRIQAPTGLPSITAKSKPGQTVLLYFTPPRGSDGGLQRGKPKGVLGMLVVQRTDGIVPKSPADCNEVELHTRSPKRLVFNPDMAGKIVYLYGCWISAKGERGPWSALHQFKVA